MNIHYILTPLSRTSIGSVASRKIRVALEEHRAEYIQRKYNVKLLYPKNLPSDLFWRDYFQVPDFLVSNDVVIDVGASIEDFVIVMAKAFNVEKVIAIEPDEILYSYLRENIKLNSVERIAIPLNVALGERVGIIKLYKTSTFLSIRREGTPKIYHCTTLDKIVKDLEITNIDLIKIDTEGSELNILKGANNILRDIKPKIILEAHSKKDKYRIIEYLKKYDYKLVYEKVNFPQDFAGFDYISVLYFYSPKQLRKG